MGGRFVYACGIVHSQQTCSQGVPLRVCRRRQCGHSYELRFCACVAETYKRQRYFAILACNCVTAVTLFFFGGFVIKLQSIQLIFKHEAAGQPYFHTFRGLPIRVLVFN